MTNAIEHGGLHRRVVNHVLKNERLPYLQFVVETPKAHEVARETRIATDTVDS